MCQRFRNDRRHPRPPHFRIGIVGGVHIAGAVLVNQTADGVPLGSLWDKLREALEAWKECQDAFTSSISSPFSGCAKLWREPGGWA
jgi:hypothetical protein